VARGEPLNSPHCHEILILSRGGVSCRHFVPHA